MHDGTHDIQRNTREASQPQGAGKGVMGSKDEGGWKVADNMHKRSGGAPSTEHEQSDPLRPDGKDEETSSKGDVRLARR